jgi:cation diffusion facilitator family transporter
VSVPQPARDDDIADRRAAHRAVTVSAVGLAFTAVVELYVAVVTGSAGLLGDALHNLADVSTSGLVLIAFWVSKRRASAAHPYGFDRAEDLAGLGIVVVIIASAVISGVESVGKLAEGSSPSHLRWGMAAAALGIVGNQVVARYKFAVGRRIRSATLVADARHSWTDALSSAGALAGLVGVAAGYGWADAVAGFVVTGLIGRVGWQVARELAGHLMDAVDPELLDRAREAASGVAGVLDVEARGRWAGRTLHLELRLQLAPTATLADAAHLGEAVRKRTLCTIPEARHVHVCAEPRRGSCTRRPQVSVL